MNNFNRCEHCGQMHGMHAKDCSRPGGPNDPRYARAGYHIDANYSRVAWWKDGWLQLDFKQPVAVLREVFQEAIRSKR